MSLQNIFTMIKADRYTEDGCGELNKARKEIEDARRTYKAGEISEKTGLQKQGDGSWAPPKETKFGKVQQNKEGQWGVQTKQGKGSDFLKHKSEKEAMRALANYTAGYNTTERSKQDPHSDYARQQKQWNKETDRMRKNSNAERRAEHAAQFQKKPENQGAGNNGEGSESKLVQWMKEDPSKLSDKELMERNETLHDLGKSAKSIDGTFNQIMNAGMAVEKELAKRKLPTNPGGIGYEDSKKKALPEKKSAESKPDYMQEMKSNNNPKRTAAHILERGDFDEAIIGTMGDESELEDIARDIVSPKYEQEGDIPADVLKTVKTYTQMRYKSLERDATKQQKDSAPRVLTGDCRIRVRK